MQERAWIDTYIRPWVSASGAAGLSDDVALLRSTSATIITMDTLIAGVHFLDDDPLGTVGQKLVRVNVSDIHAKGARPAEALLSVAWPHSLPERDFAALMAGFGADLLQFGATLIGGDLVGTPGPLTLTLTLTGQCLASRPVRRSGGKIDDGVFVHGEIGWGRIGLIAARQNGESDIIQRYRVPEISGVEAARSVARYGHAALDISDGLLADALSLAEASGCGVALALDQVPLAQGARDLAATLKLCTFGDDYRILLTAPDDFGAAEFTRIGKLVETPGLHLAYQEEPVANPETLGFVHSMTASTEPDLS